MFLLFKAGLSFDGLKYFEKLTINKCSSEEILSFWSNNFQMIFDQTDKLDQKENPSKTTKSLSKAKKS